MKNKHVLTVSAGKDNVFADNCEVTIPSRCFIGGCRRDGSVPITVRVITQNGHIDKPAKVCGACVRQMDSVVNEIFSNVSMSVK
jgi:hypothetical protein